jgi:hypothetical protein
MREFAREMQWNISLMFLLFFLLHSLQLPVNMIRFSWLLRQPTCPWAYMCQNLLTCLQLKFGGLFTPKNPIFPKSRWFATGVLKWPRRPSRLTEIRQKQLEWRHYMYVTGFNSWKHWSSNRVGLVPQTPHFWGYFDQEKSENLPKYQYYSIPMKFASIDRIWWVQPNLVVRKAQLPWEVGVLALKGALYPL